jgi:pre-mRNA-splicing factor SPF27
MIGREYERVKAGQAPFKIDRGRYELQVPPANKMNDETAWKLSLQTAQRLLQYQTLRMENLDLLLKYGPDAWKQHNQRLEVYLSRFHSFIPTFSSSLCACICAKKYSYIAALVLYA